LSDEMSESESKRETSVLCVWWVGRWDDGRQGNQCIHIYLKCRATF
jgi:hypothetical protein